MKDILKIQGNVNTINNMETHIVRTVLFLVQ